MKVKKLFLNNNIDVLNDKPIHFFTKLITPLAIIATLSVFTGTLKNKILSDGIGPIIFTIISYLTYLLTGFAQIVNQVVSSAWIKTSRYYLNNINNAKFLINSIYAIVFFIAFLLVFLLIFSNNILNFMNVPSLYFTLAKQYYILYLSLYVFIALANFFIFFTNSMANISQLFLCNIFQTCAPFISAFVLILIFKFGFKGGALCDAVNALFVIILAFIFTLKNKKLSKLKKTDFKINFKLILEIYKYSIPLILHELICYSSYITVSIVANKNLEPEFITVLSITMPLTVLPVTASPICMAFFPANFAEGNVERVKKMTKLITLIYLGVAIVCTLCYLFLGELYYSFYFNDAKIILYGKTHWRIVGIGQIMFSFLVTIRIILDAVGYNKLTFPSCFFELTGNLIGAFILIPKFGAFGMSFATPLGYMLSGGYILIIYFIKRKKIYLECQNNNSLNNQFK